MKCVAVAGPKVKQFIISNLNTATHYRVKGEGTTEYAITAVHTITPVPSGNKITHKVEHNGALRPLEQIHLLREEEVAGPPEYQIKLSLEEAKALSEILRMTRLAPGRDNNDALSSVVNHLYNLLPRGYDTYDCNMVGGALQIVEK
jgi:hypothetical protein